MDGERKYVTYPELSALSGYSVSTLGRLARKGAIQKIQPGGPRTKVVFRPDVLDQLAKAPPELCTPTGTPTRTSDTPEENPSPLLPGPKPLWMQQAFSPNT